MVNSILIAIFTCFCWKLLKLDLHIVYSIIMASRIRDVKDALEKMILDASWKTSKGDRKSPIEMKLVMLKNVLLMILGYDISTSIHSTYHRYVTDSRNWFSYLHLIYYMWDSMMEEVKIMIFEHEGKYILTGWNSKV